MKVAITHTVVMAAPKSVLTSRAVLARSKSNWCESTKRQLATQGRNWTIGQLDESCISNSKSEIGDWTVQFPISDFEFEMQDSSNCPIVQFLPCVANYVMGAFLIGIKTPHAKMAADTETNEDDDSDGDQILR